MDACDPDVKTKNIRKLIRIHTGRDLNISKERMCEISTDIAKGNLPLPPLVLTRDKRYLLDSKSPLSRQDYESLYNKTMKFYEENGYQLTIKWLKDLFSTDKISLGNKSRMLEEINHFELIPKRKRKWSLKIK